MNSSRSLFLVSNSTTSIKSLVMPLSLSAGGGGVDTGEEAEETKYSKQLLELLKKEGGGSSLFEAYCQPFEDHYGDHYEWQGDTATQHYLCRLLDAHYNHQVTDSLSAHCMPIVDMCVHAQEQEKLLLDWEEFLSQCKPQKNNKELLLLTGERQKVLLLYLLHNIVH